MASASVGKCHSGLELNVDKEYYDFVLAALFKILATIYDYLQRRTYPVKYREQLVNQVK